MPTTNSLAMLLEQALQSSDDTMLEGCLAESSEQVVESTVKRMPLTKVVAFLDVLTEKIERQPSRGTSLGVWVKAVLMSHAGFLTSVPNLHTKLAVLYEVRRSAMPSLKSNKVNIISHLFFR